MKKLVFTGCYKKFDIILQSKNLTDSTACAEANQDSLFNVSYSFLFRYRNTIH